MKEGRQYRTSRAITALVCAFIINILIIGGQYVVYSSMGDNGRVTTKGFSGFWACFYPALLIAEIFIYRWLHHKYIVRLYANIHIWSVIIAIIILPVLGILVIVWLYLHPFTTEYISVLVMVSFTVRWGRNIALITGHIFFILLILERNNRPVYNSTGNPGDHLNEFDR